MTIESVASLHLYNHGTGMMPYGPLVSRNVSRPFAMQCLQTSARHSFMQAVFVLSHTRLSYSGAPKNE